MHEPSTTPERFLSRLLDRPPTVRVAALSIALATAVTVVIAGLLMWQLAPRDFPTLGSGLWWAVQTVTTVGYGDVTPRHTGGRIVAAVVMVLGVALISVVTAAITATFIERARRQRRGTAEQAAVLEALARLDERLERVERALADGRPR